MISHTMNIWERIIDRRLREETSIGEEQFGFMPSRGTTECHICSEAGDSETPGDAEGTASILYFSLSLSVCRCSQTAGRNSCWIVSGDVAKGCYPLASFLAQVQCLTVSVAWTPL